MTSGRRINPSKIGGNIFHDHGNPVTINGLFVGIPSHKMVPSDVIPKLVVVGLYILDRGVNSLCEAVQEF